ncbi:MAG: amidohydrolase [Candidatus Sumerlaeia bacterium]|nr:amidohydrolase [Candidatus Sumerlaeia bacterium]
MHRERIPELEHHTTDILQTRRHLHRHPELSNQEHETAAYLASRLASWDIPLRTGIAGTGVVALIEGQAGPGPTVAIRGDMDALPIHEERQHGYVSTRPGVMHACGHDAHMTMALFAGRILHQRRATLRGCVKILFQPSEEASPSGAEAMVRAGALADPPVDAVLGIHVFPYLPSRAIGVRPGVATAAADEFEILVHGRGGHAGYPHLAVDPIVAAAHVILALQTIASRRIRPNDPVVVTVGTVDGGTKANIIPPTVRLRGTFRTQNPQVREQVAEEIDRIAQGVANSHGATAEVTIHWGCPSVINDPPLTEAFVRAGQRLLGEGAVQILPEALMGADDFAFYQQHIPGVYFRLGTGNAEKGTELPLHHPRFDIDEDAMPIGVAMLVEATEEFLRTLAPVSAPAA